MTCSENQTYGLNFLKDFLSYLNRVLNYLKNGISCIPIEIKTKPQQVGKPLKSINFQKNS